ncbi:MAG: LysR family transcriptional regulator [Pusillimonas sp.]
MELKQLQQFLVLGETLNFSRAAEQLNMAQPALSISIRKLEDEWSVQLFARNSKGVSLTEAGRMLLEDARQALFYAEQVSKKARGMQSGDYAAIRIAFIGSAIYSLIPSLLPFFHERYPGCRLELTEMANSSVVRALEGGEVDIGLVRLPVARTTGLKVIPLQKSLFSVIVHRDNELASRRQLSLKDLVREPFIQYTGEQPGMDSLVAEMFQKQGVAPTVVQWAKQVQTMVGLVESGMGVALVPSVSQKKAPPDVVYIPLVEDEQEVAINLALICRDDDQTDATKRFVDVVLAWQASQPQAVVL